MREQSGAGQSALQRILSLVAPDPQSYFIGRGAREELEVLERAFDDTVLNASVKAALHRDPELRTAGIHVATSRSVVQLSGFVDSRRLASRALEKARQVRGVRLVRNDTRLK